MEPVLDISRTGYGYTPISGRSLGDNGFSDQMLLAKAGELLRSTSQHANWTALRQKNDALAVKAAKKILIRHELLERLQKGENIDWARLNTLTRELKDCGIYLYSSSELSKVVLKDTPQIPLHSPEPGKAEKFRLSGPAKTGDLPGRNIISDENIVILNAEYKNYILNQSLVGYGNSTSVYLPLSEMSRTLDFEIDVDTSAGKASGWYISEDRRFSLDLKTGIVVTDGREMKFSDTEVIPSDGDFFVDSKVLSRWFPVDYKYQFSNQSLTIEPREKIPFQRRLDRELAGQHLKGRGEDQAVFPRKESEYDMFSLPFVDLGVSGRYAGGTENDNGLYSGFYINAKGDLGKMNTEVFLSGSGEAGLEESRVTFQREDPEGGILGLLDATSVGVGDVRVAKVPILGGGESERGLRISNEDLIRSKEFDTTFFQGNLSPGWDVEVYRNSSLVATQRVGQDGQYTFNDIPVYYGKNEFTLKFYGPQGQEREEIKEINVGGELIKKGDGEYRLSVSQKNTDIYDPEETSSEDDETLKFNAYYTYGLTPGLSLNGGAASQDVEGERHNYLNIGTKGILNGMYLSGDYVHDTQGGDAVELFAQKGFKGLDLRVKQQFFNGFVTDGADVTNPMERETDISVSGRIQGNDFLPNIPFTLGYDQTKRESSNDETWSLRTSSNVKGVNLNNRFNWREAHTDSDTDSVLDAQIQATTYLGKFRLRGLAEYEVHPDTALTKAELSAFYNISGDLSTEFSLTKDMAEEKDLESALQLNWSNGTVSVSPRVSYNRNGEWDALLSLSTSFGREPRTGKITASSTRMADSGSVSAKVFHDKNQNQVFDAGDKVIEGAVVKAVQAHRDSATDDKGVAFLTGLQKNKPTDITLDTDSLADPFWAPVKENQSIVPRPGHVEKMDIPVVTTGEIDGTLVSHTAGGMEEPLGSIKVQLLNEKGDLVQEVRSEYDGYYYFPKVFPGRYSVRVSPENAQKLDARASTFEVEIDDQGTVASGNTIIMEKVAAVPQSEAGTLSTALGTVSKAKGPVQPVVAPITSSSLSAAAEAKPVEADKTQSTLPFQQRYGLHMSSYKTPENAAKGIAYLIKKHNKFLSRSDFTIKKVALSGGKGTWYRVIVGTFSSREKALEFKDKFNMAVPYAKVVSLETPLGKGDFKGVHLTSYRNHAKAEQGIDELKDQYPDLLRRLPFTVQTVDLGPKMGTWNRVVAGKYTDASQADRLVQKLKGSMPYCMVTTVEKQNEFSVHLASYRTPGDASAGLGELQDKLDSRLDGKSLFIRRTDLGKKGIWYRIYAGNFEDKGVAVAFKNQLGEKDQFARVLRL